MPQNNDQELRLSLDLTVIDRLEPHLSAALEDGLLNEEEAFAVLVDEIMNTVEVIK